MMWSRRWILNYLMFVLIIVFTWIGMRYPGDNDQHKPANQLTSISPAEVSRIRIETADATIELGREKNRWMVIQPIDWFAHNIAAERIASLASAEYQSRLPSDQIDLATLGLTLPKAVVTLNSQVVSFGATNQIGNRRYLATNSEVFLVSDLHFPLINTGLAGLVDKRLLPPGLEVTRLELPELDLALGLDGWAADRADANREQLAQLVNRWQRSEASSISPYQSSVTPLFGVGALTNQGPVDFYVLSIEPEIVIARPDLGLQYHFPDHLYYDLLALPPGD